MPCDSPGVEIGAGVSVEKIDAAVTRRLYFLGRHTAFYKAV